MNGYELYEYLREVMHPEVLLEELVQALSDDELYESLKYIAKMWDIEIEED